jgi:hypothetical protein
VRISSSSLAAANQISSEKEMRTVMRIRVTTRADLFEKRKQQHIDRGYRIEDERPIPVNGFCSFIVVSEIADSDGIGALVAEALNGMAK